MILIFHNKLARLNRKNKKIQKRCLNINRKKIKGHSNRESLFFMIIWIKDKKQNELSIFNQELFR